jgi:hypothetical protein
MPGENRKYTEARAQRRHSNFCVQRKKELIHSKKKRTQEKKTHRKGKETAHRGKRI